MKSLLARLTSASQSRFRATARGVTGMVGDERGVTALEYGIVATFLVVGLVAMFVNFSATLTTLFSTTTAKL